MKKLLYTAICLTTLFIPGACTEDTPDVSDVVVFVEPSNDSLPTLYSGDKKRYELELSTIHDHIHRFSIKSFDVYRGYITLLDSVCEQKRNSFTYDFVYTAPEIDREQLMVELTFTVEDNEGNVAENKRNLRVKNKLITLNELNGIVLYSPYSDNPDAINLADVSQPFTSKFSPDSLKADLYVEADTTFIRINWKSRTKAKFVRNNSFNYTTATATQIQAVYQSSVRSDAVQNLSVNDIILIGHNDTAEGVFHIKNIIPADESGNKGCLQLGYKGIKTVQ